MGVLSAPEIRTEFNLTPKERAKARDAYIRSFERQFVDWHSIASCCLEVEHDEDWKILGFHSFSAWLKDAAPVSERYLYLAMSLHKGLSPDIPAEELREIPVGTAELLQRSIKSKGLRRDPRVIKAAKQKPRKFVESLKEIAPEQHVETIVEKKISFTLSQWEMIEDAMEAYNQLEPEPLMAFCMFFEFLANDWLDGLHNGSTASRRSIWERIKAERGSDAHQDQKRRQNDQNGELVH